MAKKKSNELFDPTSPYLAALAVGSKFALEGVAGTAIGASALFASPALIAAVCAAGAFMIGKTLFGNDDDKDDKVVREMLERTRMNVEVDKKGQVSTTVSSKPSDTDKKPQSESVPAEESQDHPVVVEEKNGTKILHIQNLSLYLTPELISLLNLNPKEGIKQLVKATHLEETKANDPVETAPIRDEILLYVSCLRTKLAEEWKSRYQKVWADILDLEAVNSKVYDPGKQQGTNFNRNLVANIVHYLNGKGVFQEYNAAKFASLLEGTSDHSVRAALGSDPNPDIVSRLDRYFET